MKIILTGIEYSGTTTMAKAIGDWYEKETGQSYGFHDHFKLPHYIHAPLTEEEQEIVLGLSPRILDLIQKHQLDYHVQPTFYKDGNLATTGLHIEDAVYGPLYWGYGGPGERGDRSVVSREIEDRVLADGPDTVLVLLKASAEVIASRMKESPHESSPLQEKDIAHVLERFEEEYDAAILRRRFTLDTSEQTVEETLQEFVRQIEGHLSPADRRQMLVHKEWDTIGSIR